MDGTTAAGTSNQTLYIGLGCGVGGLLLLTIGFVCFLIVRKIRQHRRDARSLEQGQLPVTSTVQQSPSQDIRSSIVLGRRGSLLAPRIGWDALSSTDTLDQQAKGPNPPTHQPKKSKKYGIALKRLKHLSAITESPRSRNGQSPSVPTIRTVDETAMRESQHADFIDDSDKPIGCAETADIAIRPGEDILDKHINALGLKLIQRAVILEVDDDRPKPPRSVSVGALLGPYTNYMDDKSNPGVSRPRLHVRSVSLGGQPPEHLPPDPTPNLPVISPHNPNIEQRRSSQESVSSQDSASSSVLINSPFVRRNGRVSPVALQRRTSQGTPHPIRTSLQGNDNIESQPVSPLTDNGMELKRELPSESSISSFDDETCTTSFRRVTNPIRPNKSRISPAQSRNSSVKATSLARRVSHSSVSATGSPTERKRPGVLRDISGNSLIPSRRLSTATSTNSSETNPFQWDNMSLQKPSAMKGSPNAKKGHKRQNCVRISTLTPQVLGPPPSRSTSPSITHRIDEESSDETTGRERTGTRFLTNRRPSRPLSGVALAPSLRVQTLRASLTPSSPTLSMWSTFQDALPSQPSDSHLTTSTQNLSRSGSNLSSAFSIPAFPSPSRAATSDIQLTQPTPEFCISRPSMEDGSSPFDLHLESDAVLSSSPPILSPAQRQYDPAWPPLPKSGTEEYRKYDPASPMAPRKLFEQTPPADSTVTLSDLSSSTSTHRAGPQSMHSTPSVFNERSLKSTPNREVLTSHNASSMMAQLPNAVFPGAPILSPPRDDNPVPPPPWVMRSPSPADDTMSLMLSHQDEKSDKRISGPRVEPAKSVLKNAMALRRMNSEIDTGYSRESRRFTHLARERSIGLPMYGNPDLNGSCDDFDFGFDSHRDLDAGSGALESLGIVSGSLFSREASSFYHDIPSPTQIQEYIDDEKTRRGGRKRHAVTLDIDNPWRDAPDVDESSHTEQGANRVEVQQYSPAIRALQSTTPRSKTSISATPQSLYSSDGFLRSDC